MQPSFAKVELLFSLPTQTLKSAVQPLWYAIELSDEIFTNLESLVNGFKAYRGSSLHRQCQRYSKQPDE